MGVLGLLSLDNMSLGAGIHPHQSALHHLICKGTSNRIVVATKNQPSRPVGLHLGVTTHELSQLTLVLTVPVGGLLRPHELVIAAPVPRMLAARFDPAGECGTRGVVGPGKATAALRTVPSNFELRFGSSF